MSLVTADTHTRKSKTRNTGSGGGPSLLAHPVTPVHSNTDSDNNDNNNGLAIITKPVSGECLHLGKDFIQIYDWVV